jgi:hypothetical protein
MFNGKKTTLFWIGLIILGYSLYQFALAVWNVVYYAFAYPSFLGYNPTFDSTSLLLGLGQAVPNIIGGLIFLPIGLYIMKVGVETETAIPETDAANTLTREDNNP